VLPPVLPTANKLKDLPKYRVLQGRGVASIDLEKLAKEDATKLMERNQAARAAEREAIYRASNAYKPAPTPGGTEESTLLSKVALVAGGILLTVAEVLAVVYQFYSTIGLFLEGM
jgi:hypothetical protein